MSLIDEKERLLQTVAGVSRLRLVAESPVSRVFRCVCTSGSLMGQPCVLKELRGPLPLLRTHDAMLTELESVQANAAGISRGAFNGVPRILHHGVMSFPDGDIVVCYVRPWLEGTTLADIMLSARPTSEAEILAILAGASAALRDARSAIPGHALIYQDIKPSNLIVLDASEGVPSESSLPTCAMFDLDLAFMRPALEGTAAVAPTPHGTPGYAAPEAYTGAELTAAFDVFSFGVTAYEALAGALPYRGNPGPSSSHEQWAAFYKERGRDAIALTGTLPASVTDALASCLEFDPAMRPSMGEVAAALADLARASYPASYDEGD